jgi:calcineurin-like phosphoesterase family protein
MADRWNSIVKPQDTVYILGDFASKRSNCGHWQNVLNGKKILVQGNHDNYPEKYLRNFTEVCYSKLLNVDGQKIFLSHYPHLEFPGQFNGGWHLYGHCHARLEEFRHNMSFDVSVDAWDYYPVSIETVFKKFAIMAQSRSVQAATAEDRPNFAAINAEMNRELLQG